MSYTKKSVITGRIHTDKTIFTIVLNILMYYSEQQMKLYSIKEGHQNIVKYCQVLGKSNLPITHIMSCSFFISSMIIRNITEIYGDMRTFALGYPKLIKQLQIIHETIWKEALKNWRWTGTQSNVDSNCGSDPKVLPWVTSLSYRVIQFSHPKNEVGLVWEY